MELAIEIAYFVFVALVGIYFFIMGKNLIKLFKDSGMGLGCSASVFICTALFLDITNNLLYVVGSVLFFMTDSTYDEDFSN